MPHTYQKSPNLHLTGPIVSVTVIPPQPVANLLKSQGKNIPSVQCAALIDTGATNSCIDKEMAAALGLVSHNSAYVKTAGGVMMQPLYDVAVVLPISKSAFSLQVFGIDLKIDPYKVLIGRDMLKVCTLTYNGWDNSFTLHL